MDFNATLDLIARLFVIIGLPAGAVWALYRTQYLPWKLERDRIKQDHEFEASADTREYQQATNTGALKQVINLNESLVKFLIDLYDKLTSILSQLPRLMGDVKTQMEISNRDRVRNEEILEDIDQELHAIKELLRVALSRNGTLKDE